MCHHCGEAVPADRKIGFSDTCPSCGADMHVCALCFFYSPGAHWDCRETVDAMVADKHKRNYCEWFSQDPRFSRKTAGMARERSAAESAKSSFDALFKR